ncbi:MAG TPA: hypothetical protein VKZ84_03325 [Bacteriovoracaceae bacterium]|nr:hypothetical protein [Bacteriovoracaceae bacterium]
MTFLLLSMHAYSETSEVLPELHCKFTGRVIEDVHSIVLQHDKLVINDNVFVPLDLSEINCSTFGRQMRLDGSEQGYKVILKSCTSEGVLEGRLIDNIKQEIGDINCYEMDLE